MNDPVVIVGLNRELEYKAGTVWPYQRRVIEIRQLRVLAPDEVVGLIHEGVGAKQQRELHEQQNDGDAPHRAPAEATALTH